MQAFISAYSYFVGRCQCFLIHAQCTHTHTIIYRFAVIFQNLWNNVRTFLQRAIKTVKRMEIKPNEMNGTENIHQNSVVGDGVTSHLF